MIQTFRRRLLPALVRLLLPLSGLACGDASEPAMKGPAPPECGNGAVEPGENCDDGNTEQGDGCFECQVEDGFDCGKWECAAICGDGQVLGDEICDDGDHG